MQFEMNVLVVDDYMPARRIVRALLRQMGFQSVDDVGDAESAFAKLQEASYGLIVSDWKMEPVSGLEFLKQVRADENLKLLPFLMVTAAGSSQDVAIAKEAGVTKFVVKPFSLATLSQKVHSALGIKIDVNHSASAPRYFQAL